MYITIYKEKQMGLKELIKWAGESFANKYIAGLKMKAKIIGIASIAVLVVIVSAIGGGARRGWR